MHALLWKSKSSTPLVCRRKLTDTQNHVKILCRPSNVLLNHLDDGALYAKVSSPGLFGTTQANSWKPPGNSVTVISSEPAPMYTAPEVMCTGEPNMQGDSFSFGMVIVESIRCGYMACIYNEYMEEWISLGHILLSWNLMFMYHCA